VNLLLRHSVDEQFLQFGFTGTGAISLCIDSFVFVYFVFTFDTAYLLYYCNTVGWTWWDWSL